VSQCPVYDALGRVVEIDNGGSSSEIWYTQLGKTVYMNGAAFSYVYWPTPGGGTLLQNYGAGGDSLYFQHKDWLGSSRVSSTLGTTIIDDRAFAPYGEIYDNFGSASANENMFTGDTQDILATLDCCFDTPNREQSSSQGRWLSPDPAGSGWNQYAYATNPNSLTDPSGLCGVAAKKPWNTGCNGGQNELGGDGYYSDLDYLDTFGTLNVTINPFGSTYGTVGADDGSSSTTQGVPAPPDTNGLPVISPSQVDLGLAIEGSIDSLVLPPGAQIPTTIVQLGYVVPNPDDPNSGSYGPNGGLASIEYQVFDDQGVPCSNCYMGEKLFMLDGNVSMQQGQGQVFNWQTNANGIWYDQVGILSGTDGDYFIQYQQLYVNAYGGKFPLSPTYTQTSIMSNGFVTVMATPNVP
jgi:RHS repeat-associated protein